MKKGKGIALLPIGVFLVLYLGLGILFEYVMEIPMGFYNVPIVVAFPAAILLPVCRTEHWILIRNWKSWHRELGTKISSPCF